MSSIQSIRVKVSDDIDLGLIQKFAREKLVQLEASDRDSQEFLMEIPKFLHDNGILQIVTPKEFGGREAAVADLIWIIRELSYGSPSAAATFIGNLLGYSALILYGQKELRERLCRSYMKDFCLWSFAMTEAGAGSDLMNIATNARRTPNGFVLNGEKNFITNATHSSHMAVFARLYGMNGEDEGISCFYVPGNAKGLTRGEPLKKIGWKRANTGALYFKDVVLGHECLLGTPGQGLRILTQCLNRSKTLLGAMGVGIATRALDLVYERLCETTRFTKKLIDLHAIRHVLARAATQVDAAWLLVSRAAATWDAGLPAVKESSMAKLMGGNVAVDVSNQAMELFGARGFLQEFEVSRLVSDAKAIDIVEGPSLVQELLIAKEVVPVPKSAEKKDPYKLQASELKKAS
ncbi:MAG TPA: acyl-CoA dehydrogenase family protein [Bdellovibrionales bacterium]|nr:acyl-CoA dehydrogenase family protein [Bdellovibrionales bacterium]